jgi:hypothetical protein
LSLARREALVAILDRLAPTMAGTLSHRRRAYNDAAFQAEDDRWVRPEVEHGRHADIEVVPSGLSAGEDMLPLTEAKAMCWLRAFNHLRVAAGDILDLDGDAWEESADAETRAKPEFGILIALGWI